MATGSASSPQVSSPLIRSVPGARPALDTNVAIQLVAGAAGTAAVWLLARLLKGTALSYLWTLVGERGPVQYVVLFMAFMVVAHVFLKIKLMKREMAIMMEGPVDPGMDLTRDNEIAALRERMGGRPDFSQSIVLNRLDRILALWLATHDVGRLSTWASLESQRDGSESDSSYALTRALIWAIPILGFIGTVLGLGGALAAFSSVAAGAVELGQIKEAIAGATGGLGVAFDTTLLALLLVTVLMFPLSSVQRREENLLVEIDTYMDDALISRLPSPGR